MPSFVAWLRGINVGKAGAGRKSVPMPKLRELAEELGFETPRTHLQSGNLVFGAGGAANALADRLEAALQEHLDLEIPVVVSTEKALRAAAAACPFPDAADERPKLVQIAFSRKAPTTSMVRELEPYCGPAERCALASRHVWFDHGDGIARSKITPSLLDRVYGAPVTARNIKTLHAVLELLAG